MSFQIHAPVSFIEGCNVGDACSVEFECGSTRIVIDNLMIQMILVDRLSIENGGPVEASVTMCANQSRHPKNPYYHMVRDDGDGVG